MTTDPNKAQRIIAAAVRLFGVREFGEITLEAVAKEAAVAKGTLYLYFSDKDDLFFQSAISGFDEMCERLRASAAEGAATFDDRLVRTCQTIGDFFRERRPLFRMILFEGERTRSRGATLRQRWLKRRKQMTAIVTEILAAGVASGDLRSELPAEVLAEYLLGMLRTRSWELENQPEARRTQASVVELFLHGAGGCRPRDGRAAPVELLNL